MDFCRRSLPALVLCALPVVAQTTAPAPVFGPYNGRFIASGLPFKSRISQPLSSSWSIATWLKTDAASGVIWIGGLGASPSDADARQLVLDNGKLALWSGGAAVVTAPSQLNDSGWHFVAATNDGFSLRLFVDGKEAGTASSPQGAVSNALVIGPVPAMSASHLSGYVAGFSVYNSTLTRDQIGSLGAAAPNLDLTAFDTPSNTWPFQTREQVGYRSPQDPSTLPHSSVGPSAPVAKPITDPVAMLTPRDANTWAILGGWNLAAAPDIPADGSLISMPGYKTGHWLHATVPGTVLTTYIDRGVYPDPDYGLNNLAIPEKLARQQYWYRVEFTPPANLRRRNLHLVFNGINYAAVVWLNGKRVGEIKGAFIRGDFDVSETLEPGKPNVLAVWITPPPHPGIPQEQSVKGGPGENGGAMCLDGPTFVATEGWDWIPAIRDRNSGMWQEVWLRETGDVRIGDPQVIAALPLPDTSRADVFIAVPLHNRSQDPVEGEVEATFEGVQVSKRVTAPPGNSVVRLTPTEFNELTVQHPRLWWPNGYGSPELYHLQLAFRVGSHASDSRALQFGIRQITYELSLLDHTGKLRRVEISPTDAPGQSLVNVMHEGMIQSAPGWVSSLRPEAENSPAVHDDPDTGIAPYLAIKVNGVRIACKGGNWGMDDSRKRVSKEHLEPFFRLHREANLNIIRNWVGQDTEEAFYDLADKYGLLVWNDFWDSTQNYNAEPDDSGLFLANARDVILRFRNHPSIVMWCGRNEGVPAPTVNKGLDDLIRTLDGTRYYSPSSNVVNLQQSGPYHWEEISRYFTEFAHGFAVELGIPSLPTLDAFESFVAEPDRWPPNDVWAYHDWHASGNGVIGPFMNAVAEQFGPGKNLEDFERKAQILNYDGHRAIFEGFNAHLWNPNSGRMLWMTQPAWPSTMWQILSSDYDTQASYYGVKKASEFVHVQLNLPDLTTAAVNETSQPIKGATLRARIVSRSGATIYTHQQKLDIPSSSELNAFHLDIPADATNDVVFLRLELLNSSGALLSDNFYSQAAQPATYQQLNDLPQTALSATATASSSAGEIAVRVELKNTGSAVTLSNKLTLRNADGTRVLPAYYSDNYVSLLPGESQTITVWAPATSAKGPLNVTLSGWNSPAGTIKVH